jgi:uncharacterized protein YbjT (DUF2867 family)
MSSQNKIITVFGGAGFVGQYVIKHLARAGFRVRAIVRDVPAAAHLKTQGDVGQIALIYGDITKPETYASALKDAYGVINLVGILFEKGTQRFDTLHHTAPATLAEKAKKAGATRFLHMSSLGVEHATTARYAASKSAGEEAVLKAFPEATIFKPSVIFGAEDNFYNQFAKMGVFSPALPLIAGGDTLFQPVYVDDVACAFAHALQREDSIGKRYELGGVDVMSFKQILQTINFMTNRNRMFVTVPRCVAHVGAFFAEFLPTPPLTRDQVEMLKYDNIVQEDALTLKDLGIEPTDADLVVPAYLDRYAKEAIKDVEGDAA